MEIIKGDFLKRLIRKKDEPVERSSYLSVLKDIAPLSSALLGDSFLNQALSAYLKEIVVNPLDIEETVFYFPLFLRKANRTKSSGLKTAPHIVELIDYEFVCYQALHEEVLEKENSYSEVTNHICLNPLMHTLQFEHDIHDYALELRLTADPVLVLPKRQKTLQLILKNPKTKVLSFFKAGIIHAALMDELHDGLLLKRTCLANVQNQFPEIPQRDWILALQDLKSNFALFERP